MFERPLNTNPSEAQSATVGKSQATSGSETLQIARMINVKNVKPESNPPAMPAFKDNESGQLLQVWKVF